LVARRARGPAEDAHARCLRVPTGVVRCRRSRRADDEREPHAAVTLERTVVGARASRAMPTCGAAALLVILLATGAARATGPAERRCERALARVGPRLL